MPIKSGKRSTWAKNFGASVKFSAIDILKDIAPNTVATSENARDGVRDVTKEIRAIRSGQSTMMEALNNSPFLKYTAEGMKNAVKDLKSGKLNNQERIQKMADAELDDFSMDDGMDDFSPSSDSPSSGSSEFSPIAALEPSLNQTAVATRQTAIATQQLGVSLNKQTSVIASSFSNSIATNKQIATTTFAMNQMMHEQRMSALSSVNENLSKMIDFNNETVGNLAMGSLKYYDDSLNVMNNILTELKRSNQFMASKEEDEEEPEVAQHRQIFSGRGVMKFSKYPDMLKKNFAAAADEDPILNMARDFLTNEEALKMLAANPLGGMSTFIASSIIPVTIKRFVSKFDETIGNFFPALFMKINRGLDSDNPLKSMLSKIFGIRTDMSERPNFSRYEKGTVPFDGVTRTAITSVIPNLLSGILAAVSGKEERTFDYERGEFTTKREMHKRLEEEKESRLISPMGKAMSEMTKTIQQAIIFRSQEERDELEKDMKRMFVGMGQSGKLYNPRKDNLMDLGVQSSSNANILKAAFMSLSHGKQMSTAMGALKGRESVNEMFNDQIAKNPAMLANLLAVYGGMPFDEHIDRYSKKDASKYKVTKGSAIGSPVDEYGKTQLDLLRDMKEILLEGITVYPVAAMAGGPSGRFGGPSGPHPRMSKRLANYGVAKGYKQQENYDKYEDNGYSPIAEDDKKAQLKEGKMWQNDVMRMDADQILAHLNFVKDSKSGVNKQEMGGIYAAADKYLNNATFGEKIGSIKDSIEKFFKSPIKLFTGAIDKIDSALYTIIYGDDKGNSIVSVAINSMKNTFSQFTGWLKKKYKGASNALFGEDGLKGTKAYKWAKQKGSEVLEYIIGKKTGEGKREGGVLSGAFSSLGDIFKQTRSSLFGTKYTDSEGKSHGFNKHSVFNEIKIGVLRGWKHMNTYLFGEPKLDKDGKKMSFADRMYDTLGEGYNNFKNFFFGTKTSKEGGQKEFKDIMLDFKAKMPKGLAFGIIGAGAGMFTNFGVLGSLFLPGGPVGGAILGTAVGLLSQSEKFKHFLFGDKDVNGKRMGGIVSKKVIDWFHNNKTAIIGGGMFGAVKGLINSTGLLQSMGSLGYMTSMFLPGGPVGGAVIGAAVGLGMKSKTFQRFLYGKDDGTGTKKGGLLNKSYSRAMKKHLPNMAFGALSFGVSGAVLGQMGIMGAMLTPAGPIGAAIMGAATGIAISSQKFRKYLFGEKDEKTGFHKAGLFDKLSNVFKLSIVEPFKLKLNQISFGIEKWFTKSIANPFKDAMMPLKVQFKVLTDEMKSMFVEGWKSMTNYMGNVFTKYVGMPIGTFMEKKVLKPLRSFLGTLVNGIGKVFGTILSSPVKALSVMASSFRGSQERRGIKQGREERSNNLKASIVNAMYGDGNTEGNGVWDNVKRTAKGYFSSDVKHQDKKRVAWYIDKEDARIKKRDEEQSKYFAEGEAKLKQKEEDLKKRQKSARDINFDTSFKDKDGNLQDAGALYSMDTNIKAVSTSIDESNAILTKIKNIVAGFATRMTGNSSFINDADPSKGIKSSSLVQTSSDKKKAEVQKMLDKMSDNKSAKELAEEQAGDIANSSRKFMKPTGLTGKKKGPTPKWASHKFDLQMFGLGMDPEAMESLGIAADQQEANKNKAGGRTYNQKMSKTERDFDRKNKIGDGDGATKYLRIIASNVDGQLNGVGSNVYKMRKAIESITGHDSGDEGSNNKDRVSFWGKARRTMMMMLRNPVAFIGSMVMKPFQIASSVITKTANAVHTIANGVMDTVHLAAKGIVGIGKKAAEVVFAIPKMAMSIVKGVAEAATDLVTGGIKVLTHGVVGLIDTSFKLISGAGKAIASVAEGLGKGTKYLIEGAGLFGREIFRSLGAATGMIADLAITTGKTLVEVAGSAAKMVGGIATSVIGGVANVATTLVGGVTNLITTASNALFSIITSPFKWVGGLLDKVLPNMNKVYVTGGTLDTVRKIEVVEKLKSSDSTSELIQTMSGGSANTKVRNFLKKKIGGKSAGGIKFPGMNLQMFADGKQEAGMPAATNLTADMLASGVVSNGGGLIKRTAATMNAVKSSLADKLFARTNGTKQTSLLDSILGYTKKHTNAFSKFVKWLMAGFAALMALLRNLKLPFLNPSKALGATKKALDRVLDKGKNLLEDAAEKGKKKIAELAEAGKKRLANASWFKKAKAFVKGNMPHVFGTVGEDAAEYGASSVAEGVGDVSRGLGRRVAGSLGSGVAETSAMDDAGRVYEATVEQPGTISANQGENMVNVSEDLEKKSPEWMKTFKSALSALEKKASGATGAALRFADSMYAVAAKKLTGSVLVKWAGQIVSAVAKTETGLASLGVLDAALLIWNTGSGLADAANIFKINQEAVTVPMRICAAVTKAAFGCTPMAIVDVIFTILGALMGFDHMQYFASLLYKIIADSDSIAKLEAAQADFEKQASDAGMSVDDYNKSKNESTFDKTLDTLQAGKDSISKFLFGANNKMTGAYEGGIFSKAQAGIKNNLAWLAGQNNAETGEYEPGVFSKAQSGIQNNLAYLFGQNNAETGKFEEGAMKKGIENNAAYLFGQNNAETGKFEEGALKKGLDNNLAWLFGQNDAESGNFKKGAIQKVNDRLDNELDYLFGKVNPETGDKDEGVIKKGIDNNLAWIFGQNGEDGGYQGGVFSKMYNSISDKIDNTLAWLFGQNDAETGDFKKSTIQSAIDNNLAWIFGQNDEYGHYQGGIFSRAYDGIKTSIDTHVIAPLDSAWKAVEAGAGDIKDHFMSFKENADRVFEDKGPLVGTMDIAANIFRGLLGMEWSNDPIQAAMDGLISGVSSAFNGISDAFTSLMNAFQNFDPIAYVKDFFQKFMDNLLPDSVKQKLNAAADSVSEMADDEDKAKGLVVAYNGGRMHDAGAWIANKLFGGGGVGDKSVAKDQFAGAGDGDGSSEPTEENGFTYYSQDDPRWKDQKYGQGSGLGDMGDAGCGPTAMAMVASDLTGEKIDPTTMANYSLSSGYRVQGGTDEGFFSDAGSKVGLQSAQVSGKSDLKNQLAQGNPVILGGRSSGDGVGNPFTKSGHYSVAVGLSDDGTKAIMNDPRGPQYSKAVDINKLASQTVTGYSFSNNGFTGNGPIATRKKNKPTFKGRGPSNIDGDDILAAGETRLGIPYELGGDGNSTTDCGKFTLDTFADCGLDLGARTADEQYNLFEQHGAAIDPSEAAPGDLLFFANTYGDFPEGTITHVGIYAGNNYALHAGSSTGVAYADMSRYLNDYLAGAGSIQKLFGVPTGKGKGSGAIKAAAGKKGGKGKTKPKTLMDLMGHISQMYGNFAQSVIGGKVYTGTPWETDNNKNGGGSGMNGNSAGSLGGGNVDPKVIYNFLKDKGYDDVAIAAILGNIQQEHNFSSKYANITYDENGTEYGGLGLFQWSPSGGRLQKIQAWAEEQGRDPEDAGTQLDFFCKEVAESYNTVSPEAMNGNSDPGELAAYFNSQYESGTPGDRSKYANDWYENISNGNFSGGGPGDNPKGWRNGKFANLIAKIMGVKLPDKKKKKKKKYMNLKKPTGIVQDGRKFNGRTPSAPPVKMTPSSTPSSPVIASTPSTMPSVPSVPSPVPNPNAAPAPGANVQKENNWALADTIGGATVGDVTQADVSTFTGGEYFNDANAITKEAKAFVHGSGDLDSVATSIGLQANPDSSTPLSAKQQWMLGFREYSPIRTWAHYLTDSYMWKRSGSTSLESWMANHDFSGGGSGDSLPQGSFAGLLALLRKYKLGGGKFTPGKSIHVGGIMGTGRQFNLPKATSVAPPVKTTPSSTPSSPAIASTPSTMPSVPTVSSPVPVPTPGANIGKDNSWTTDNADSSVRIGDITQADVSTFTGGEYFNDTSAITKEAKDFVHGSGDLSAVATSIGLPADPDPATPLTAKQQWMLGFREYSPIRTWQHYLVDSYMWKRAGSTSLESWMANHDFSGGGLGDVWKQRMHMYDFMIRHHVSPDRLKQLGFADKVKSVMNKSKAMKVAAKAGQSPAVPKAASASKSVTPVDATKTPEPTGVIQADIHTFKGGEYFNDPTAVTQAAKDFAAGKGSLDDVAKSVGFKAIPSDDTSLTVDQQQMLGFREYSPIRTWAHYLTESYMWQHGSGKTSVESWMAGKTPIANPKNPPPKPATPAPATTTPAKPATPIPTVPSVAAKPVVPVPVQKVDTQVPTGAAEEAKAAAQSTTASILGSDDISKQILEVLNRIAENTCGINSGVDQLTKNPTGVTVDGRKNIVVAGGGGGNTAFDQLTNPNGNRNTSPEYDYNRKIAAGGAFAK